MAFIAGYGGAVTINSVALAVGKWKMSKKRALANVTNSKSNGHKQRKATIKDTQVTLECPLDDALNPEDSGFTEGAEVALVLAAGGGSTKTWTTTAFIVESCDYENDEDEDVMRLVITGYCNVAMTYSAGT